MGESQKAGRDATFCRRRAFPSLTGTTGTTAMKLLGTIAGAAAVVVLAAGAPATAAQADPALQAQLLQIYDSFNQDVAAGKITEAIALRSASARTELSGMAADPKQGREMVDMLTETIPTTYDVMHSHMGKDGGVSIDIIAHTKVPAGLPPGAPPAGSIVNGMMILNFVKEGGAWRFDSPTFGPDPASVKACPNTAFEPLSAYDQDQTTSLGGPIDRVTFEADYTLVVIRVVDEDTCAYLPNKAALTAAGIDIAQLTPYTVVSIDGIPHKSDKQKVWGSKIEIADDY